MHPFSWATSQLDPEAPGQGFQRSLAAVATVWLAYQVLKMLYNIFLHPLKSIPGPRLAAATYLPEFYHDVLCVGRYTGEIRKMHEIYGEH